MPETARSNPFQEAADKNEIDRIIAQLKTLHAELERRKFDGQQ